jgi:hypothetical protein
MRPVRILSIGRGIHKTYALVFAAALFTAGWVIHASPGIFDRFLGQVDAISALLVTGILGHACLSFLVRKHGLKVSVRLDLRNTYPVFLGTILFGTVVILMDYSAPLPADINIAFPTSLLFYPMIGFLAEIIFHVIPMTLISGGLALLRASWPSERILLISLIATALVEPVYHVYSMYMSGEYGTPLMIMIGIHILLFSLFQLNLFRRQGFFHMYLCRLCYYQIWHVLWGTLRLQLLYA